MSKQKIIALFFIFFLGINASAQDIQFQRFNSVDNNIVNSIIATEDNKKIIGTPNSVFSIGGINDTSILINDIGAYVLVNDNQNKLWMGQTNNVLRDSEFKHSYPLSSDPEHTFYSMEADENRIYIASKIGLISFKKNLNETGDVFGMDPIIHRNESLDCKRVNTVHLDLKNNIWIGTDNAIFKINSKGIPKRIKKIEVTCMTDYDNSLWVAGPGGIWQVENYNNWQRLSHHQNLTNHKIEKIIFDQKGRLWVGGNKLFCCDDLECIQINEKSGYNSKQPLAMAIDDNNILWIGTAGKGLLYADLSKEEVVVDELVIENETAIESEMLIETETIVEPPLEKETIAKPVVKTKREKDLEQRYDFMSGYADNNILLLIDVSNSMERENKLERLKNSLKSLVNKMRPEDQVSIMLFTKKADLVLPPTSCINANNIHTILDSLKAHGGSYLDNGIRSAVDVMQINYLRNGNNRILLATDGLFNISEDVYKLVKKINKKDISLSVINFSQTSNERLKELSEKGGGNYWKIKDSSADIFRLLEKEVKSKRK